MTLHDWEKHMTAKGITHNDAVRMLKDAEAEIEQLRSELNAAREEREQFGKVHKALHDSWMNLADEQARLRSALCLFETVVKFAAATIEVKA